MVSAPPSGATTSVSTPAVQQHLASAGGEVTNLNLKGIERAITLAGDESKRTFHCINTRLSKTGLDALVIDLKGWKAYWCSLC